MKYLLLILGACATENIKQIRDEIVNKPVEVVKPIEKEPELNIGTQEAILSVVDKSSCKDFWFNDWDNGKQKAPRGFVNGLALSFVQSNCKTPQDTSKWAQLISHGLWESSGKYCEGADLSSGRPNSITSISAEAGFAQTSYDSTYSVSGLKEYIASWQGECFTSEFSRGFKCTEKNLKNYGTGVGFEFQKKAKSCGAFAADVMIQTWPIRTTHYFTYKKGIVQEPIACKTMFESLKQLKCGSNL